METAAKPVLILVVDEDDIARELLCHVLHVADALVLSCDGIEAALQVLGTRKVDILVSEPLRSEEGFDLLERVRADWPLTLRVLLLSSADPGVILRAVTLTGVSHVLLKSMSFPALRHVVAELSDLVRNRRTDD
jgi:response regulator RpfG family c-di-GMP phosphodiesterase